MKFNFLGGQHKGFSPNQNTQETVNMFLEVDSSEENKLTLYRVDGKKDFIELPKSPVYNMAEFRGALYVVAGDSIYKIIETVSGEYCTMDESLMQQRRVEDDTFRCVNSFYIGR